MKSASPFQQYFQSRNSVSNPYSQFQNDYSTSATQIQPQITQLSTTTTVAPVTTTTTTPIPSTTQAPSSFYNSNPYSSQSSGSGSQNPYSNYYDNLPNYGYYNRNGVYQFYSVDPSTYQFIPTNVGQNNNGQIRFVPCMCPIGVSVVSSENGEKNQNFGQQQQQQQVLQQYQQSIQPQSVVQQPQQPVVSVPQVMYPESSSNSLPQSIVPASPSVSSQIPERPEESVQI